MTTTPQTLPTTALAEDALHRLGIPRNSLGASRTSTLYESETGASLTSSTKNGYVCVTAYPEREDEPALVRVDVCRRNFSVVVSGNIFTGADEQYLNEITVEFLRHVISKFNA